MTNILNHSIEDRSFKQSCSLKAKQFLMNVSLLSKLNTTSNIINYDNITIGANSKFRTAFKPLVINSNEATVNQITVTPYHHTMPFIFPIDIDTYKPNDRNNKTTLDSFSVNTLHNNNKGTNVFLTHKTRKDNVNDDDGCQVPIIKSPTAILKHYSAPVRLLSKQLFASKILEREGNACNNIQKRDEVIKGGNDLVFTCSHTDCGLEFKTKKQNLTHHIKMSYECHGDTITLLKAISNLKRVLILLFNKMPMINKEELIDKYENVIKSISIEDHAALISGLKFYKDNDQISK